MKPKAQFSSYFTGRPDLWAEGRALPSGAGVFEFGFEAEFNELEPLLAFYEPVAELAAAGESAAATAARLRAFARGLEHGDKRVILVKRGGPDFLPATIFRDDTGNLELALAPVRAPKDFWEQICFVNSHLGRGSLQAMVSLPREEFFAEPAGALGWLNFFGELDVMERLERARRRGEGEPVRSFLHPYLGPMVELRHQQLRKYLRENAAGNLLAGEELARVGKREQSFKFVGGTAYRPDVAGPHRICLEVRDAHRDADLLRERVARILHYWRAPRGAFSRFASVPAFDSAAAFAALPDEAQALLRRECAIEIPARVRPHAKPLFAYEVFRNFAYPGRDWMPYAELLAPASVPSSLATIRRAQADYAEALRAASALPPAEARRAVHGALARFPAASGLYELFRAEEARLAEEVARG